MSRVAGFARCKALWTCVECKSKSDTNINWGNWKQLKIIHNSLSKIMGEHEIKELQKRAILGTEHILQKVQM